MKDKNLTILFLEGEIKGRKAMRDNMISFQDQARKEMKAREENIEMANKIIEDMETAVEILKEK